jgi:Family of unknown function (DUF6527)
MPKIAPFERDNQQLGWMFECPGCRGYHVVYVDPHRSPNGSQWLFNGDIEAPTFEPSINYRIDYHVSLGKSPVVCHLYVTNGKLQFLDDCTHALKGQTIAMPEYPDLSHPHA